MPGASAADRQLLMEVERGNLNRVTRLLGGGANVNGSRELDLRPLISAARSGNTTMIKLLISNGADLEVQSRFPVGCRAIHAVISSENPDALRALIEAGASVNSRDGDQLTALMSTPLSSTAGVVMAQELFTAGADPFVRNHQGMTSLHSAAGLGNTQVMEVMLANAPLLLNAVDSNGFTPMGIAAVKKKKRAVSWLLAAGATDERVHEDQAAIFWAAEGGLPNMVRMMLKYPIDRVGGLRAIPNSLGVAIQGKQARMLDALLSVEGEDNRAKWAECPLRGGSPLSVAAAWVSLRAMHVLLAAGADETRVDRDGQTVAENIGRATQSDPYSYVSAERLAYCRRMLERGPAFRTRSYGWSTQVVAAESGSASEMDVSSRLEPAGSLGVKVYRPVGTRFFPTRFARYAKK